MQRSEGEAPEPPCWRCGPFVIEPRRRRLLRDGMLLDVEERTFDLIALLVARHERAVDRREIIGALWGARPVSDNTLRQVVYKARQALGDDGRRQAVIRTLHGRSLRWVVPVDSEPVSRQSQPISGAAGIPRPLASAPARLFAVAAVLFAGLMGVLLVAPASDPPVRQPVEILPIVNATGDGALDWTRSGLALLLANLLEPDVDAHVGGARAAAVAVDLPSLPAGGGQWRAAHGATIVIEGRLRKLEAATYELDLRVQTVQRSSEEIRVAGPLPGTLAADAIPRLRLALARSGQLPASPTRAALQRPLATR